MSLSIDSLIDHTHYMQAEILKRVGNKHIYILGTKFAFSDVRVNAPFLVRLNEAAFWGNCDLWINNSEIGYFDESYNYNAVRIARMPTSEDTTDILVNYPEHLKNNTHFISPTERAATIKDSGIEYPMLCTLCAHWFHKYTNNDITLLNCSFSQKVNRYPDYGVAALNIKYSPKKDEEYLQSLPRITLKTIKL